MDIVIISVTAFGASLLTFFSGFGLGTILTPVFALFFPLELAIAMTGMVHLLNNLFKTSLTAKSISKKVVLKFGLPAILGAFVGAWLLNFLTKIHYSLYNYQFLGVDKEITAVKITVAILMISFALFELIPQLKEIKLSEKALSFGGVLSGFFGGLSGHQGALRSVFLLKLGLSKNVFIASGIAIACLVDLVRIPLYFSQLDFQEVLIQNLNILLIALFSAFFGAFLGKKLLTKITIDSIQLVVGIGIILLAITLGLGII